MPAHAVVVPCSHTQLKETSECTVNILGRQNDFCTWSLPPYECQCQFSAFPFPHLHTWVSRKCRWLSIIKSQHTHQLYMCSIDDPHSVALHLCVLAVSSRESNPDQRADHLLLRSTSLSPLLPRNREDKTRTRRMWTVLRCPDLG